MHFNILIQKGVYKKTWHSFDISKTKKLLIPMLKLSLSSLLMFAGEMSLLGLLAIET